MKEGFNWQMTLITFLPHTHFKKKNVLTFLIGTVISMGKGKKWISLLTYRKSTSSFSQWNDSQWAESGGQGDLGQIFVQSVNFQEHMAQKRTATNPLSFWHQKNTDQSFQMRYCKILYHTMADFVYFYPKTVSNDFIYFHLH